MEHRFLARPLQYKALQLVLGGKEKYVLLSGGIGSGKTTTGTHFSINRITENPETVGLICANTYKQLNQSTLKVFFSYHEKYGIEYLFNKKPNFGYKSKFKNLDGIVSYPNGCQVITRSLDNYDDLRGLEIGWVWLDESRDTNPEAWDIVKARLRCKQSRLLCGLLTSTPKGYDWLYTEFVDKPNKQIQGKVINPGHRVVTIPTYHNSKNLPEGFIEQLEASYDPQIARQEIGGEFINICQGRVYREFERDRNLKQWKFVPQLPIILCFDFNVDPMKWALIQNDGENDYVFDEVAQNNTDTRAMAEAVRDKYGMYRRGSYRVYGDYSGNYRDTRSRTTDWEIVKEVLGIPEDNVFVKPNPPIDDRINAVNARLRNLRGITHLFVDPDCEHTIKDFERVVYGADSKIEKKNDDINRQLTHISDAIGYYCEFCYSLRGLPTYYWRRM